MKIKRSYGVWIHLQGSKSMKGIFPVAGELSNPCDLFERCCWKSLASVNLSGSFEHCKFGSDAEIKCNSLS